MKRLFTIFAIGLCTIAAVKSNAQDAKTSGVSLSIGAELAIPTGDLSLVTPLGLGGSVKAVFPLSNVLGFTVSAGYQHYLKKNFFGERIGGFHGIPLKGGIRVNIDKGFYIEPQAGYTSFGSSENPDAGYEGAFTYAGNVGYLINGKVDISIRYESATKGGSSLSHVGLRIAYNFKL